jgi:HK97 family phage prohead protease
VLVAVRSFADERHGAVLAGVTRVAADHELVRRWPERFQLSSLAHSERGRSGAGGDAIRGHHAFGYVHRSEEHPAGVMAGILVPFREEAEINSPLEGHFLERFEPGALARTLREDSVRVLLNHGRDPVVGDKPVAVPLRLWEDSAACRFEAALLDAGYVRDHVLPGLRAGVYGISFRFRPSLVDVEPPRAGRRLARHSVREARLREFGPVTFPSYSGTSVELAG